MRCLICDDHPLMREALATALLDRWPHARIDQAGSYPEAWALAKAGPDFAIVDLSMPGATPLDGLAGLPADLPVIVLTGLTDPDLLGHVAGGGHKIVLSKNMDADAMLDAIGQALADRFPPARSGLSPRQIEVLGLIARGLTNKQIALQLAIAPETAKVHVARILDHLGASNRTDAVFRARRGGLL